ncbi:uncharacterized protein LOC129714544 isoform X2 [Leucoraja erinacea]|uniref:uncharacterized protein LOC129714544 isoform X2 n=1 Tax=Leucoraja erinaceus TaxID=7782 RepID=UPI002453B413|nr:uncharacterized protein LOC129714544 isoform X2 [Leucoraja erinacea]
MTAPITPTESKFITVPKSTVPSTSSEATTTASSITSVPTSRTVETTAGNTSASSTEATTTFMIEPITPTESKFITVPKSTVPSTSSEATTTASSITSVPTSRTVETTAGNTSASSTEATTTFMIEPITPTAKGNGFEVQINTDTPAVEIEGSLNVTCRTTCLDPIISMELKPGLNKYCNNVNNSITCQIPTVKRWDLPMVCSVLCKSVSNTPVENKTVIIVYNRDLVIAPHPKAMEINKTYQLNCTGPRVYPNTKLHLKWLRGSKVVKSVNPTEQKFPEDVTPVVNILNLNASMAEDGQVYTCLAELDLVTNTTKEIESSSVTLQTYFFSEPVIQASLTIIDGKPVNITCSVFNVSGELQLTLKNGNMSLPSESSSTEHTIYHTLHPKMEMNGQQLTCVAKLTLQNHPEPIVKQQNITLNVQSEESSWVIIIVGFSIVGAIIIIIMAIICYCRIDGARKTGEYNVLNPTPSRNQEIPRVNESLDIFPLQEVISNGNDNNSQT